MNSTQRNYKRAGLAHRDRHEQFFFSNFFIFFIFFLFFFLVFFYFFYFLLF